MHVRVSPKWKHDLKLPIGKKSLWRSGRHMTVLCVFELRCVSMLTCSKVCRRYFVVSLIISGWHFQNEAKLLVSVPVFVSITWKIRFDVPDTPVLQNFTKTNNDDGSVTLKWNLINEGMTEYIKYIVEYGDKKFILLASEKEFRISAGYERIKLSVKVSKNA